MPNIPTSNPLGGLNQNTDSPYTSAVKAPPNPAVNNGLQPAATAGAYGSPVSNAGIPGGNSNGGFYTPTILPVSTTTISNANKQSQVPKIQSTTQNLSQKGNSYDTNGNIISSNGTVVPPPATSTPPTAGTYTDALGHVQTAALDGSTPPAGSTADGKGNYIGSDGTVYPAPASDTSFYDKQIFDSVDSLKSQVAANLASQLDTIKSQYATLITQSKQISAGQQAGMTNALLRSGGIRSGSADSNIASAVQYGLQQVADLNSKEDQAIQLAQGAALTQDIQLQDQYNTQINKLRDAAQTIATKIQSNLIDATTQASKDNAISNLYTQGITNPSDILKKLENSGRNDITLKDINSSISSIVPPGVSDLVKTMTANSAPADMVQKVLSSPDMASAITNAGDYLQNATGTMGDYLAYKRDAEANKHVPEDFTTWQKAQDARTLKNENSKAYGTAFNTALGKAKAEAMTSGNTPTSPITDSKGNTYNVPASVAPYAKTADNGVRYVDLSDFKGTPTEAHQAVSDAQGAGLRIITNKNSANDVQNITDALSKLNRIQDAFTGIAADSATQRNLYQAAITTMAKKLQTDPNAAASDVYQDAALDILKAMSGTQGFRGGTSMVQSVQNTFPKITDTKDVVNQKISNMKGLIQDRETALVGKPSASDQLLVDGANAKNSINSFYPSAGKQTQGVIDKLYSNGFSDSKVLDYLKQNNLLK